jgi:hypothetical protein
MLHPKNYRYSLMDLKLNFLFLIMILTINVYGQEEPQDERNSSFSGFPAFAYQPETSFQFGGAAIWILNSNDSSQTQYVRNSTLAPFFIYTLRNQVLTEINLDYYFSNGMNLNLAPGYFSFPDYYFGIGNDNDPDVFETYTNAYIKMDGFNYFPLSEDAFFGVAMEFQNSTIKHLDIEGPLTDQQIDGMQGGTNMGFGPAYRYDTRDNTINPSTGYFITFHGIWTIPGEYDFSQVYFNLRRYIQIRNEKNVLAFNLNTRFTYGDNIPFYKLHQLGGGTQLRGIANASLYRDKQAVLTQVEFRRHLFWNFGCVIFTGIGDVSESLSGFEFSEFKVVGGLGLRYALIPEQRLNLRIDYGFSQGGQTGFYIGILESF